MRLLLDTHFVIWLVCDPTQVSTRERDLLSSVEQQLVVSAISLWELRIKADAEQRRGKAVTLMPDRALEFLRGGDIELLDLTPEDCALSLNMPLAHTDPFDGMLLVHAQRFGARLLTRDAKLRSHPLALVP